MIPWMMLAYAASSAYQAHEQKAAAEDAREFQAGMSSTAHQREVRDLRAAGLNPILSGTGGMGASSPMGPAAQVPDYGGGVVSSAVSAATRDVLKEQKWNTMMDTAKKDKERTLYHVNAEKADQERQTEKHRTEAESWNAKSARWRFETDKAEGELSKDLGEARPGTRLLMEILRGIRR